MARPISPRVVGLGAAHDLFALPRGAAVVPQSGRSHYRRAQECLSTNIWTAYQAPHG